MLPVWRHRRVVDLQRRDVRELVERKARTAPIQANRVLQRISAMLTFAVDQDWIESNPAWRIKKPGRERSRDRVLTRDELRELWAALHETEATNPDGTPKPRLSQTLNDMLIVMLLTAQRRGEVCTMRWQDVDLVTGWWMIPAESSKNADPHRVPLTPMVLEILERRAEADEPRRAIRLLESSSDLCRRSGEEGGRGAVQWRRVVPLPRARLATDGGVVHGRSGRRSLSHRARPEPSQRDAQHRHGGLRSVPLRQGEACGAREVGRGAAGIVDVKPAPTTAPAKRTRARTSTNSSRGHSDVPAIRHERPVAHLRSLRSNSRVMRKPARGTRGSPQGDPEWNYGNTYVTIVMLTVLEFLERDGASPFGNWFAALDAIAAAKITTAVRRLELGNFSNVKGVGAGVFEYRIDFGPGYRVYFGKDGDALVILLGGGTKKRQDRDIATAHMRWKDYKKRKSQET